MAESTPPPGTTPPLPLVDAAAIGKLIREELDRSNKYLEFAQGQIEKDRSFYKHLYVFAGAFIAFMVTVAGYFQYTSVSQIRTDMKASVAAELDRNKAEIAALRAQALTASAEAQTTVSRELANVRIEVQKRIDNEFQSENIGGLVRSVAKDRTEKELAGIIRSETATQVAGGIKQQGPVIQKAVEDQTKEAVKALEPTIRALVTKATEDQVIKSVAPVQIQMGTYADYIRIGTLAMLANGDDRHAFDTLVQIVLGKSKESKNPDLVHLADATLGTILSAKTGGIRLTRSFKTPQPPDSLKQLLQSRSPWEREAALDNYPANDRSVLPILVEMIKSDDSIDVLVRAVEHFNSLTKQTFQFHQTEELLGWWQKNEGSFR